MRTKEIEYRFTRKYKYKGGGWETETFKIWWQGPGSYRQTFEMWKGDIWQLNEQIGKDHFQSTSDWEKHIDRELMTRCDEVLKPTGKFWKSWETVKWPRYNESAA